MTVRFTRPALNDKAVTAYPESRSPQGARHVRKRIKASIERLDHQPWIGLQTSDPTIRRLIPDPDDHFRIWYQEPARRLSEAEIRIA